MIDQLTGRHPSPEWVEVTGWTSKGAGEDAYMERVVARSNDSLLLMWLTVHIPSLQWDFGDSDGHMAAKGRGASLPEAIAAADACLRAWLQGASDLTSLAAPPTAAHEAAVIPGVTVWHGYPQHPQSHPERPWWRRVDLTTWLRSDGRVVEADRFEAAVLAAVDAEHPLPCPPPLCGQVWLDPSIGLASMVTGVYADGRVFFGEMGMAQWPPGPPSGAVLVAGPGAPWAPPG